MTHAGSGQGAKCSVEADHPNGVVTSEQAIVEDMNKADIRGLQFRFLRWRDARIERRLVEKNLGEIVMSRRVGLGELAGQDERLCGQS